jgi:tRNA threonylcarbamoyladenosine biosynthesis protein TsaE
VGSSFQFLVSNFQFPVETSLEEEILFDIVTHAPEETIALGRRLAVDLRPPCWVLLQGELGSGKTTLVKGIVGGLGAAQPDEVTSPSFTLVHEYGNDNRVYHVDLYRIENDSELATLGLDDLLRQQVTTIVEWSERLGDDLPVPRLLVQMEYLNDEERRIRVKRLGK